MRWPDGASRETGELKCFAIGSDANGNFTQINFNQILGTASIVGAPFGVAGQAYEYNAWAFQALAGTLAQGYPVGNTPGTLNLFSVLTTTSLTLNPAAPNTGCIVSAGLPNAGNACGQIGTQPAFQTDNAHIGYTGILDIDAPSGTANFTESGNFRILDFQLGANQLPATVSGVSRPQGGTYDIYATYLITGTGQWAGPFNFLTTGINALNVTLYASPASGTPMALGAPGPADVTPGSRDILLGTATLVPDPTNFGSASIGANNQATTSLLALLQFTPAGGPTGPLTGPTGFFQAPVPFVINIGAQAGGNGLNTSWIPFNGGYRIQTLQNLGGGSISFVAQTQGGYDSCPNILVGAFQPHGVATPPSPLPPAPAIFAGGLPGTQISIAACDQDLTQRARPFITKYTWTFWNEDEFSRTGTHECGDSYYETSFPALGGVAGPPNPGPFQGFPLAQFSSLGTPTAYFRLESLADTYVCANAVHFGMIGVIAHANNGVYVRGTNLIGRGTQPGVITWDPGPADSFKK